jgi:hypothetical protein
MMIRPKPEFGRGEDRSDWQNNWTEDERMLAHTPPGYWVTLIEISQVKRILLGEMPADLRLRFLEQLNERVYGIITTEAMQRVEPACATAMKMLAEMETLNVNDKCRLLMRWNVMATFIRLNPSILEAIRMFTSDSVAQLTRASGHSPEPSRVPAAPKPHAPGEPPWVMDLMR